MLLRHSEWLLLTGIAVGVVAVHLLGLGGPTAAFFALFAVIGAGHAVGSRLFPESPLPLATIWGSLTTLALLMLLRGVWFYTDQLLDTTGNTWTTMLMLVMTVGFLFFAKQTDHPREEFSRDSILTTALCLLSIAGFALIAHAAFQAATTDAIRTPWPLLPRWTLPLIGVLWILPLVTAWRGKQPLTVVIQAVCALAATVVITPLLYRIGYGFDGFLHVAGELILAKTGTLSPKPPYYMGQYVFVAWLAQLFDLEIARVDRWLVPVASALLLPMAAFVTLRRHTSMLAALVLVPIGALIATTPHGFATTLGIVALLLTINAGRSHSSLPSILFAAWAALTHPLVGLPILCAVIAAVLWRRQGWLRWLGLPAAIVAGISVPLLFGLASRAGAGASASVDFTKLFDLNAWHSLLVGFLPWVPNRYALWPQASVWVEKLLPWVVAVFAILALRRKDEKNLSFAVASASTFIAASILKLAGDFGFLIDYERGNYADRLFLVAGLLLLPLAIPELGRRLADAKRSALIPRLAVLISIGLLGAGASYAALPRHDAVTPSRGWSMGRADLEAVRLIDEDADGAPYTVLANQTVSAAAVKTFGFKHYHNDVFFYPIPTGGALYDVFLKASYEEPSREVMKEAATLGGSDLVYFVVNNYWWKADSLSEAAASSSDRTFVIQDGKVKVFKYELK